MSAFDSCMIGRQGCYTAFDRVFCDDTAHVSGCKYFTQFKDYNEIGEVLAGRGPGRRSDLLRIIDYNLDLGLHDVSFVAKIYEMLGNDCSEMSLSHESFKFWI